MYPKSKLPRVLSVLLILVALVLLAYFTAPKKKTLGSEELLAYSVSDDQTKEVAFFLEVYPSNATGLSDIRYSVKSNYEGEDFFYHYENNLERDESFLPLQNEDKTLGVVLPTEDFSEMIVLFSDDMDFTGDESLHFVALPEMTEKEAQSLYQSLKDNYDLTNRPIH